MAPITFTIRPIDGSDVVAGTWTLTDDWLERAGEIYYPGKIVARVPPSGILSSHERIVTGTSVLLRAITDRVLSEDRALVERYLLKEEAVLSGHCDPDYPYREIAYATDGTGSIVVRIP